METQRANRHNASLQRDGPQRGARFRQRLCLTILVLAALLGATASAQAAAPDTVKGVRFGDHTTFERAVIDLGPGNLSPDYSSSYREGDWVVRVKLPTVDSTLKTGGKGLGRAISRYYVVRTRNTAGGMFVDLHLTDAARSVRIFDLNDPARIVVDVVPGGQLLYPSPAVGPRTVVMRPRAGTEVGPGSFVVSGYGRPFEARGAWLIKDGSGNVVRRGMYATGDWSAAWGAFGFTPGYPPTLSGHRGTLVVGAYSSRDGRFEGISIPLRFEQIRTVSRPVREEQDDGEAQVE
ncbi:MAG TPA: Gmad2 immunoglobulin-like domain-containing protein [Rubrobacteraceae bacterium]|nr:Gmad2 immunoglobulin-like domain-containing protein [Rubrobacteraceae bacterium]